MKIKSRRIARAELARGESLTVADGEATTIRIDCGCVWITEEGSFIDHVLVAGQRYTFDRPGVAIVSAQVAARVTLVAPGFSAKPARVAIENATLYARPLWLSVIAAAWPAPAGT